MCACTEYVARKLKSQTEICMHAVTEADKDFGFKFIYTFFTRSMHVKFPLVHSR